MDRTKKKCKKYFSKAAVDKDKLNNKLPKLTWRKILINLEIVEKTCMLNSGQNQCRYLAKIENENKFICLKKTKNKIIIDSVIKETKNKQKRYPMGDNCCGLEFSDLN